MPSSSRAAAEAGAGPKGRAQLHEGASQLEVHMHEHNLGEALALLHEGGIELISDERVLNWTDLHAMGLTLEDASQLRSSLNLDATPPGGHATRRTSLTRTRSSRMAGFRRQTSSR